tara:strand:- start:1818 stop:3035 length:1218 start_codon:yes stop_codon:yes gene_type:complete
MGILLRKKLSGVSKIKNSLIWFFCYLTSSPFLLLMIAIYPFIKIRINELETRSIGHFSIPVEIFLSELKCNIHPKKGTFYIWFTNKKISNHFLLKKWKKHLLIGPRFILKPIFKIIIKFKFLNFLKSPYRHWYDVETNKNWQVVDKFNVLKKTKSIINFSEKEKKLLSDYLSKNNIKNKYICFMSRTGKYLNDYKSTRDAEITNLQKALIKYCKKNKLKAIRMGSINEKKHKIKSPYIIDYCISKYKSEALDILLPFYCKFFIGSATGLTLLPILNRKKICYVNFYDFQNIMFTTQNMINWIIPKKIMQTSNKKYLTYSQMLQKKLSEILYEKDLNNLGYKSIENSVSEIFNMLNEFNDTKNKKHIKKTKLQKKFWKTFKKYYHFEPNYSKVSDKFLNYNRILIK